MSIFTKRPFQIGAVVVADVLAVDMGMGVPIFAILIGFPMGWIIPTWLRIHDPYTPSDLRALLRASAIASAPTLILMAIIWLPVLRMLSDSTADIAHFGIPMILYQPLASFIGWIILMVAISPALQMLVTLFGSVLRCAYRPSQQPGIAGAAHPERYAEEH